MKNNIKRRPRGNGGWPYDERDIVDDDFESIDIRNEELNYDPDFNEEDSRRAAAEFSSVKRKSLKNNRISKLKNHSITSGLLDKAEEKRSKFGGVDNLTMYYDDVEYNFTRYNEKEWSLYSVDVDTATDNKWGIIVDTSYASDELNELFFDFDTTDDNPIIEEDGFELEFSADDEPEDWDDSDFEHKSYTCVFTRYLESPYEEGDTLTNDEMYKLVDDVQNGNSPYYGAYFDENIDPEEVYPSVE